MQVKPIPLYLIICLLFIGVVARAEEEVARKVASEKLVGEVGSALFLKSLRVSPDGRRVAYVAQVDNGWLVVVDAEERKEYDGIMEGTPIFSPDSKRVAYGARVGDKQFVVVDGERGRQYDAIIARGGGRIVFNPPDSLHYLGTRGDKIYLVQETLK